MKNFIRKCFLALKHRRTLLNIIRYKYQYRMGQIPQYPILINLYITEKCNASCKMCNILEARMKHLRLANGNDLDPRKLIDVVESGRKYQPIYYITGGEPLIYEDLFKVVRSMKKNKSIIAITSNGIQLEECYKDIVDEGIDFISLSLDGSSPESHDSSRDVSGAFKKFMGGVEKLIQYRGRRLFPNIKINTVIRRENLDDLVPTYLIAQSLGVDQFKFDHYSFNTETVRDLARKESLKYGLGDEVHGAKIDHPVYMSAAETKKVEEAIGEIRILAQKSKTQFIINHDGKDLYKYYSGEIHSRGSYCDEVFKTIKIRQSGQVELCQGIVIGNIYENNLTDIWKSRRNTAILDYFRTNRCTMACFRCCSLNMKFKSNGSLEEWHAHLAH